VSGQKSAGVEGVWSAPPSKRKRRRGLTRVCLVAVGLLFVAFIGLVARMTVLPARHALEPADAIVVLGGGGPRIRDADRLFQAGLAPRLFISVFQLGPGGGCPTETYSVPLPAARAGIVCFRPSPYSTRGEARYLAAQARSGHWSRVIVVASTPQEPRARFRVQQCFPGQIQMVGVRPGVGLSSWIHTLVYELGADIKAAALQRDC
jgi:uncharacterized SAM-binding protein YcdF (DUF218 family)